MVKDEEEIIKWFNKTVSLVASSINIQLSNDNRPKALIKVSPLSLVTNAIANISNIKSVAKSETAKFDEDQDNLIVAFFASKMEERQMQKKKE